MEKRVKFTIECKKAFQTLHIKVQRSLKLTIKKLAHGEVKGKPLSENLIGFNSIKDGNYRAIYSIINGEIVVFDVDHRSVIYNKIKLSVNEEEPI